MRLLRKISRMNGTAGGDQTTRKERRIMSIDVSSLIAKVIERTGQKCGQILPPAALGSAGPHGEELLVESLSTQLLTFLGVGSGGVSEQKAGHVHQQDQFSAELIERNRNV